MMCGMKHAGRSHFVDSDGGERVRARHKASMRALADTDVRFRRYSAGKISGTAVLPRDLSLTSKCAAACVIAEKGNYERVESTSRSVLLVVISKQKTTQLCYYPVGRRLKIHCPTPTPTVPPAVI